MSSLLISPFYCKWCCRASVLHFKWICSWLCLHPHISYELWLNFMLTIHYYWHFLYSICKYSRQPLFTILFEKAFACFGKWFFELPLMKQLLRQKTFCDWISLSKQRRFPLTTHNTFWYKFDVIKFSFTLKCECHWPLLCLWLSLYIQVLP